MIYPANSTNKTISWSSSNSNVAYVSSSGMVTAKTAGSAIITVKTSNNVTANCLITVQPRVCIHEYDGWITEKEATCTEDGSRYRTCIKCSEGRETEVIPALGHDFPEEWTIIKNPTCTEEGEQAHICTRCGAMTDNTVLFALGHSFTDEWITEKEATCTESGLEYELCSVCGEQHKRETEPLGHDYVLENDTPPHGTESGIRFYKCTRCDSSYSENYLEETEGGIVTVGVAYASAGGEVAIPFTLSENPGIAAFTISVDYDKSILTPKSIKQGSIINAGTFMSNINDVPVEDIDQIQAKWSFNIHDTTVDGEMFSIVFDVNENASYGSSLISIDIENSSLFNSDNGKVIPLFTSGAVNVSEVQKGDIYVDGNVDVNDSVLLAKHLAHYRNISLTDRQLDAADIFEDGNVNTKDGVSLAQILAGWTMPDEQQIQLSSAEDNITIRAGEAEGSLGEYIDIPITAEGNPGMAGFELQINYDKEYLTPVSVSEGAVLKNAKTSSGSSIIESNIKEENVSAHDLDYVTAYWNNPGNIEENGELFTVRFLINKNEDADIKIPVGISCDVGDLCNSALSDITADFVPGEVRIAGTGESGPTDDPGGDDMDTEMQYEIADIAMQSGTGEEYDAIPACGGFYLNIAINSRTGNYVPAQVIAAAYDTDEVLIALNTDDIYTSGTAVLYVGETEKEIGDIKIFIWDSVSGMMPLGEHVRVD